MKCSFCGKELEKGAEFCPECGMILSLGGQVEEMAEAEEKEEVEIPEYTPNVFRAMDFEEEANEPAMELEVTAEEETAPVVEAIPEFAEETAEAEEADVQQEAEELDEAEAEEAEAEPEEVAAQPEEEIFEVPEYDPNKEVSPEFVEQLEKEKALEASSIQVEDVPDEQATIKFTPPTEPPEIIRVELERPETEFAPPEYEAAPVYEQAEEEPEAPAEEPVYDEAEAYEQEEPYYEPQPEVQYEVAEADEEDYAQEEEAEAIYPIYSDEEADVVPEANPLEDNSLIEALFEGVTVDADEEEEIEDITHTYNKKKKSSKNGYGIVLALVVVLVAIIFAAGHVVDNVLPKVLDKFDITTTEPSSVNTGATSGDVDASASTSEKETTTSAGEKETTTSASGAVSQSTTKEDTTEKATTTTKAPTTEKVTTTKAPTTTQQSSSGVEEPSYYNMYETAFFPDGGDIRISAGPSSSYARVVTQPYGYPVYAYAKENGYYYVHSPYHDVMGWVDMDDVYEYVPTTQQSTTSSSSSSSGSGYVDYSSPYSAMIMSTEGLNFRSGPGTDYGVSVVVPGGFYVTVYGYSETNPGWVYVTVEDSRYPYASPSGWVYEDYLG